MKSTDPGTMTEHERFAEIAEIVARGIQRHLAAGIKVAAASRISQVRLDDDAVVEAPCGSNAMNPTNQEPAA